MTSPAAEVWQGGDELLSGAQWRVVHAWPAESWWAVSCRPSEARYEYDAGPLTAWAIIEVLDKGGDRYQLHTGLDSRGGPCALESQHDTYLRTDALPDRARPSDGYAGLPTGAVEWTYERPARTHHRLAGGQL